MGHHWHTTFKVYYTENVFTEVTECYHGISDKDWEVLVRNRRCELNGMVLVMDDSRVRVKPIRVVQTDKQVFH